MSANIVVNGKVYKNINRISCKNENGVLVFFGVVEENDVNLYDCDGNLLYSYTAADFLELAALPANPIRVGLVADGWNWTLADAKAYVAAYGKLNIGQTYHTESGKTEYDVVINSENGMTLTLGLSGTQKDWGDGTIDTNTAHTYTNAGEYTVKVSASGYNFPVLQSGNKQVYAVRIGNTVTRIEVLAFYNCINLRSVIIPNSVTEIASTAFGSCKKLGFAVVPNSVTTIGGTAFASCWDIKKIVFARGTSTFGDQILTSCTKVKGITIPDTVTAIGYDCFRLCNFLEEITIPSSVTNIGNHAFDECGALKKVKVYATTPPTLGTSVFGSAVEEIEIPNGTIATYQAATNWSAYSALFVELPA